MLKIFCFFVILEFNYVISEIYDDNYSDLNTSWEYNSSQNYAPNYNMYGSVEEAWDFVPSIPYNDEQGNPEERPQYSLIRNYTRLYFKRNFMSIKAPNYNNFNFTLPLDSYIPPASCNYPKIQTILNETFGTNKAGNFSNNFKKVVICPIEYYWMDFGYNQYPRYILQGFCKNKTTLTSKPCRPCELRVYSVLRNICLAGTCRWMQMNQNLLTWCTQF